MNYEEAKKNTKDLYEFLSVLKDSLKKTQDQISDVEKSIKDCELNELSLIMYERNGFRTIIFCILIAYQNQAG